MTGKNPNIFLNETLKSKLEIRSKELGHDLDEVIDLIIYGFIKGQYQIDFDNKTIIPNLDKETEEAIQQSIKDFKEGNFIEIDTRDPNFMKKLLG